MAEKCKHGLGSRSCGHCRREKETEPLTMAAMRITKAGAPVIVLRDPDAHGALVLVLDGESARMETIDQAELQPPDAPDGLVPKPLWERFHSAALALGHLTHPSGPLTVREQGEEGPSHCYKCGSSRFPVVKG